MKTFKVQDQLFLAKRLSFLTQSGISLQESITLCSTYYNKRYKTIFNNILNDIEHGKRLSESFSKRLKGISEFFITLVKRGEETGSLSESFSIIVKELTKRQIIKRRLVSALLYPICITVMTFVLTVFLILIIFPKIEPLFLSMHITLPWSTRVLIGLSTLLIHKWWILILYSLVCMVVLLLTKKVQFINTFLDYTTLHIPLISKFIIYKNLHTMLSSLSVMLQSGTPLHKAIHQVNFRNSILNKTLLVISENLEKGYSFSKVAKNYPFLFSSFFIEFIYSAEFSGNLSEGFMYMADYYDQELDQMTKILTNLFEPLIMLMMGLIVGFVALSMILPMYGLTQSISSIH